MASPNIYTGGFGGSTGADMATVSPVYSSGTTHYLGNQSNGSDTYNGLDRTKPFATLAAAYAAMSAGDTLVVLENHSETISSTQTFNKARFVILGEGSGSTAPRFTCTAATNMFDVTAVGVWFVNIRFPASTAAATARIRTGSTWTRVSNCYFECGASEAGAALKFVGTAGQGMVDGCTFISTSTSLAAPPVGGIEVTGSMSDLNVENCIFDGGTVGWSDYAFKVSGSVTGLYGYRCSMLRGSDIFFATGTSGLLNTRDPSGSARVLWTA